MAARLQAATSSGKPCCCGWTTEAGHGVGTSNTQRLQELADGLSFLLWQFGIPRETEGAHTDEPGVTL